MAEIGAEFNAVLFPSDHPGVSKRDGEVLVEPFGTRELTLCFESVKDARRWADELQRSLR